MIFPIGDFPNPRGVVPWATSLLIAVNVLVFLFVTVPLSSRPAVVGPELTAYRELMTQVLGGGTAVHAMLQRVSAYDLFVFSYGFRPAAPSLTDLLASMFLHGGLLHLAGNMLFLWIYGDNVEHRLGATRFLVAYLATGMVATLFHAVVNPDSSVPMVGASGAISGILGFYFVFFPRNQVRLLWLLPPFFFHVFTLSARLVLGMYLVLDNVVPSLFSSSEVGVAHGAHIGGFLAGLAVASFMERRAVSETPREFAHAPLQERPIAETIGEAIDQGRLAEAARGYFDLPARSTQRLLRPEHSLALATWLETARHARAALVVLRRHLRDFPDGPGFAEASLAAGRILLDELGEPTAAYQLFLQALDVEPSPAIATEARRGVARIEAMQKRPLRA